MAEEDLVIHIEGDDSQQQGQQEINESLKDLLRDMERARRSANASRRTRDEFGRFADEPDSGRQRRSPRAPGGTGGGAGGSGGGGSPPPGAAPVPPDGGGKKKQEAFFRVEGLMNLLRGGSNVRVRGIQNFTASQLAELIAKAQARVLQAQGSGGSGGIVNRVLAGAGNVGSKLVTVAKNAVRVIAALPGPVKIAGIAIAGLATAATLGGIALNRLRKRLNEFADKVTRDIEGVSPAIAIARASASISDTLSRIEASQRIGSAAGRQISANQALRNEVREFRTRFFSVVAPLLTLMTRLVTRLLAGVNDGLDAINNYLKLTLDIIQSIPLIGAGVEEIRQQAAERARREREQQRNEAKAFTKGAINDLKQSVNNLLDL